MARHMQSRDFFLSLDLSISLPKPTFPSPPPPSLPLTMYFCTFPDSLQLPDCLCTKHNEKDHCLLTLWDRMYACECMALHVCVLSCMCELGSSHSLHQAWNHQQLIWACKNSFDINFAPNLLTLRTDQWSNQKKVTNGTTNRLWHDTLHSKYKVINWLIYMYLITSFWRVHN